MFIALVTSNSFFFKLMPLFGRYSSMVFLLFFFFLTSKFQIFNEKFRYCLVTESNKFHWIQCKIIFPLLFSMQRPLKCHSCFVTSSIFRIHVYRTVLDLHNYCRCAYKRKKNRIFLPIVGFFYRYPR